MAVMTANFVESNPIPVKAAMAAMGLLEEVYRLPLVAPSAASRWRILDALTRSGLLDEIVASPSERYEPAVSISR